MATIVNEKTAVQHTDAEIGPVHHVPPTDIHLHHDAVAPEAIGGRYQEMPAKYYRSPAFIGTLIVSRRDINEHEPCEADKMLRPPV